MSKKTKKKQKLTFTEEIISWVKTIVWAIIVVMFINGAILASFVVPTGSMEDTVMPGDFLFVNKFIYGPTTPQIIPFVNIPLPFYTFPGYKEPEQGDVIVFIFPGEQNEVKARDFQYYLKRCVASAGDTLLIIDKKIYVNNIEYQLPEYGKYDMNIPDYSGTFPQGKRFTRDNYGPIRIPAEGDKITLTASNFNQWKIFIEREDHIVNYNGSQVTIDGTPTAEYVVERDYCFGMGDNRDHSSDSRFWGFVPYENVVGTPMIVYWSWDPNISLKNFGDKIKSIRFDRFLNIIR